MTQHRLIDRDEVARLLALPPESVFPLVAAGRLPKPALRLTRRIARWREADILALIEGHPAVAV